MDNSVLWTSSQFLCKIWWVNILATTLGTCCPVPPKKRAKGKAISLLCVSDEVRYWVRGLANKETILVVDLLVWTSLVKVAVLRTLQEEDIQLAACKQELHKVHCREQVCHQSAASFIVNRMHTTAKRQESQQNCPEAGNEPTKYYTNVRF